MRKKIELNKLKIAKLNNPISIIGGGTNTDEDTCDPISKLPTGCKGTSLSALINCTQIESYIECSIGG